MKTPMWDEPIWTGLADGMIFIRPARLMSGAAVKPGDRRALEYDLIGEMKMGTE